MRADDITNHNPESVRSFVSAALVVQGFQCTYILLQFSQTNTHLTVHLLALAGKEHQSTALAIPTMYEEIMTRSYTPLYLKSCLVHAYIQYGKVLPHAQSDHAHA
jgi:hypothetical protein